MKTRTLSSRWSVAFLPVMAVLLWPLAAQASNNTGTHADQQRHTDAEEVREETAEALETLKDYTVEQRDQALSAAKSQLDRLDRKIDELQTDLGRNWDRMSRAAREKQQAAIESLREQRQDVAEWYGGMRHSSAEAWEKVKQGFVDSYGRLKQAFGKAAEEFQDEQDKNQRPKEKSDSRGQKGDGRQ